MHVELCVARVRSKSLMIMDAACLAFFQAINNVFLLLGVYVFNQRYLYITSNPCVNINQSIRLARVLTTSGSHAAEAGAWQAPALWRPSSALAEQLLLVAGVRCGGGSRGGWARR